jgi:hypothetical protein
MVVALETVHFVLYSRIKKSLSVNAMVVGEDPRR